MLWLTARSLRNSVTAGLSSASFCWIASAVRYSASASDGLPVCDSRKPRLLWLVRQDGAEVGDGGVVVGQLLLDRQRRAVLGLRLRRLARRRQQDAEVVVAGRQVAAEVGDGGVVVGQLLPDRQRRAVLGLRLRRLARLRQQEADAVDRVRQVAAGVVRRPGGGGQRLLVGPRQAVGRQGVGGLARRGQEAAQPRPAGRQRGPRGRADGDDRARPASSASAWR